jgi:hypothetical protein
MNGGYLGLIQSTEIETRLLAAGASFITLDDKDLIDKVASELARLLVGSGRMGGPCVEVTINNCRPSIALGPKALNLKIKYRNLSTLCSKCCLEEYVDEWFLLLKSPYMLLVGNVSPSVNTFVSSDEVLTGLDKLNLAFTNSAVTHVDSLQNTNCLKLTIINFGIC